MPIFNPFLERKESEIDTLIEDCKLMFWNKMHQVGIYLFELGKDRLFSILGREGLIKLIIQSSNNSVSTASLLISTLMSSFVSSSTQSNNTYSNNNTQSTKTQPIDNPTSKEFQSNNQTVTTGTEVTKKQSLPVVSMTNNLISIDKGVSTVASDKTVPTVSTRTEVIKTQAPQVMPMTNLITVPLSTSDVTKSQPSPAAPISMDKVAPITSLTFTNVTKPQSPQVRPMSISISTEMEKENIDPIVQILNQRKADNLLIRNGLKNHIDTPLPTKYKKEKILLTDFNENKNKGNRNKDNKQLKSQTLLVTKTTGRLPTDNIASRIRQKKPIKIY